MTLRSPSDPPMDISGPAGGVNLTKRAQELIEDHVTGLYPQEGCGVIAGFRVNLDWRARCPDELVPTRVIPMVNAEYSPHWYRFGQQEQLRVWAEMDQRGEDPLMIYHSHTADGSQAIPSQTDVDHARDPSILHLIVRCGPLSVVEWRLWSITHGPDGATTLEVPLRLLDK